MRKKTRKKTLPGARKPKKPVLGKRVEKLESALEELKRKSDLYDQRHKGLVEQVTVLAQSAKTLWDNQVELTKSAHKLDEQYAVLMRVAVRAINEVIITTGGEDLLTYNGLNREFAEWTKFRARPDYKKYMEAWFMGVDMSTLPPPPLPEPEEETTEPEGPRHFGGDYAESSVGDTTTEEAAPEGEGDHEADALPQGQDSDEASSQGAAVSSVR
jgi:hypothetical protein